MIILDLSFWNMRWRPFRELAFLQCGASRSARLKAGDDLPLETLPSDFGRRHSEYLD